MLFNNAKPVQPFFVGKLHLLDAFLEKVVLCA